MEDLRWPDGIKCPRCEGRKISKVIERSQYDCDACRYQFSVTSGTVLHDTHLDLWKWFLAVYMMVESKKSVSANQLSRTLKISYRTAWYLYHRIRHALQTPYALLMGIVEVDETYIDSDPRYRDISKRGRGTNKQVVLGAVQRGGEIRLSTAKNCKRKTLRQFILEHIADDATGIITDDNPASGRLNDQYTWHVTVNHGLDKWMRGDAYTNTIERSWSLFKRPVIGAYHQLSVKHLDRYLDKFEFRFNNRNNPFIFRDAMRELVTCGNLEYKELIKNAA